MGIFISICLVISACQNDNKAADNKIKPSIDIKINQKWQRIDQNYLRIYFYQDADLVKDRATQFDTIYKEVCIKLAHTAKADSTENNKIVLYLLDDKTYRNYTGDSAGANWRASGGFIDFNKMNSDDIYRTLRHELIHAVTMYSKDSKTANLPGWFADGIAQYYQSNLQKGTFQWAIIKKAITENKIVLWKDLIPRSGEWGQDDRPLKYTEATCIYEYLIKNYGEEKINNIFYTDGDFYEVMHSITGKNIEELEKNWLDYIKKQ